MAVGIDMVHDLFRASKSCFEMQAVRMRIFGGCILLLLSCPSSFAANEEFPAMLRGLWGANKTACDDIIEYVRPTGSLAPYMMPTSREERTWLKISARDVLGTTQGRFFREMPAQTVNGTAAEFSFEVQALDEAKRMIRLMLATDGRLYETIDGAIGRELVSYQRC